MFEIKAPLASASCLFCSSQTYNKCSSCQLVDYCSKEHEEQDYSSHQTKCGRFEVSQGKYLKAARDLQPGDLIFIEEPLVFGPRTERMKNGKFPCPGCCRLVDESKSEKCPECFWPVCSSTCGGLANPKHHQLECKILRLRHPQEITLFDEYYRFDVLLALRALFLQKVSSEMWEKFLKLQNHLDKRGEDTDIYNDVQEKFNHLEENYLKPLRAYEHEIGEIILPEISSELIHKIYAILDSNSIELTKEIDAKIVYPIACLMENNCTPNTYQKIDSKNDFRITVRASLPILSELHITTIYTNILWGTQTRRNQLKQTKFISCTCDRCKDPTEFGTFLSGLKCMGSKKLPCGGMQLPLKPIDEDVQWMCNRCKIKLPNEEINKFVEHLSHEVDKVLEKEPILIELEDLLTKLSYFFNSNHYLMISIRCAIVKLWKDVNEADEAVLNERLKICDILVSVIQKIDPGHSRLNIQLAVILNELYKVKWKLLIKSFNTENSFVPYAEDLLGILLESKKALKYELDSKSEQQLYDVISSNETEFRNWLGENQVKIRTE